MEVIENVIKVCDKTKNLKIENNYFTPCQIQLSISQNGLCDLSLFPVLLWCIAYFGVLHTEHLMKGWGSGPHKDVKRGNLFSFLTTVYMYSSGHHFVSHIWRVSYCTFRLFWLKQCKLPLLHVCTCCGVFIKS